MNWKLIKEKIKFSTSLEVKEMQIKRMIRNNSGLSDNIKDLMTDNTEC